MLPGRELARGVGVPFLDLGRSDTPLREELLREFAVVLESGAFTNGPAVARFERNFARACGTAYCAGVGSGLDALRLALIALGVGPGDEVIVPAQTFVATWEAVTQTGALPVPVDVSEDDYCVDVAAVEAALSTQTAAIVPVHLFGQMADMRRLRAVRARHGVALVEDACQAHGAARDGLRAGAGGDAAAFSFYPAKNLGAFGDAGAVTTDDAGVDARVRALREHGQTAKYVHEIEGWTSRLDTLQALVLARKLRELDTWNEQRRDAGDRYGELLDGVGDLRLPPVPAGSTPVWHLYVVRTADPASLATHLAGRGVGTGRHYPQPPHLTSAYARLAHRPGSFPTAEALAREAISLPIFPGITVREQDTVTNAVRDYFAGRPRTRR